MSKSLGVHWLGGFFWAYDVSVAIVIAQFLDVAAEEDRWLSPQQRYDLGCTAFLGSDRGLDVERDLVGCLPIDDVVGMLRRTARRLRERGLITATEAAEWRVLDGQPILWRNGDEETEPAARLAEALIDAVLDRLPLAPEGTTWYLGRPVSWEPTIGHTKQFGWLYREATKALEAWPPSPAADAAFWDTLELLESGPQVMRVGEGPHLTVSAVVLSAGLREVLLCQDIRSGRWFLPAGHCSDVDWALCEPARRYAKERTGVVRLAVDEAPVHVAVRSEPCGDGVARHHEVTFAVRAPANADALVSDESCRLAWYPVDGLPADLPQELVVQVEAGVTRTRRQVGWVDPKASFAVTREDARVRWAEARRLVGQSLRAVRYAGIGSYKDRGDLSGPRQVVSDDEWADPVWRAEGFHSVDHAVEFETTDGRTFTATWDSPGLWEGIGLRESRMLGYAVHADADIDVWDVTGRSAWVDVVDRPIRDVVLHYVPWQGNVRGFWCPRITLRFDIGDVYLILGEARWPSGELMLSADNIAVILPPNPLPPMQAATEAA